MMKNSVREGELMGVCANCRHYRDPWPLSQLLAREFDSTDAAVAEALTKVVEDEHKQLEAEAMMKRAQATSRSPDWPLRPVMSDFCGIRETEGAYFIAEIKNAGGQCRDFDPDKPPRQACSDCTHRIAPTGADVDAQRELSYVEIAARNVTAGVKEDTTTPLVESYRKGVGARKALELSSVYQSKGRSLQAPEYLAHCGALSSPDGFVTCLTQNPHNRCPAWQAAAPHAQSSPASPKEDAMSAPPQFPIPPIFGVATRPTPTPVTPPATEILVAGPVPLTRSLVDGVADAFAWLLQIEMTAEAYANVEATMVSEWQANGPGAMEGITPLLALATEARSQGSPAGDAIREQYQPGLVAQMRIQRDPASQALIALYDAANPPLAPGQPPLTREVAEAYLAVLNFVDALMETRSWTPMPAEAVTTFAQQMAASYSTLSPAQQSWLATLPYEWAQLQTVWSRVDEAERQRMAQALIQRYGAASQATPLLSHPVVAPVFGATTAPTNAGDPIEQKSADELLHDILTEQKRTEEALLETDPEQALQVKMQNKLAAASMMSNMLNMRHQSAMAIINNVR